MSIIDCLARMRDRGQISEDQRRQAEAVYNGAFARLYPQMGPAAEARAAFEAASAMEDIAKRGRYRLAQNKVAMDARRAELNSHPFGPIAAINGRIAKDIHGQPGENIEGLAHAFEQRASGLLNQLIDKYGTRMGGLRKGVADPHNIIRELHGVDTGDATAKSIAKAWTDLTGPKGEYVEAARIFGKELSPAEDWRFLQWWESYRARQFRTPELIGDWQREINGGFLKVFDDKTHQEAIGVRRDEILRGSADKIVKDLPFDAGVGGAFANDMRTFRFVDGPGGAEAYIRLMEKYGYGKNGFVAAMQGHVRRMSRDLAAMKLFGPDWQPNLKGLALEAKDINRTGKWDHADPAWTINGTFQKAANWTSTLLDREHVMDALVSYVTGESSRIKGEFTHALFNGYRGFTTARKMGSGVVTAFFQDPVNMFSEASWLGLNRTRMAGNLLGQMLLPKGLAKQAGLVWTDQELTRLGIITQSAIDEGIGVKRFEDQWLGEKVGQRLGNFVVRASRLAYWDQIMRGVFQREFLGAIGERANKTWTNLDAPFRDHLLAAYGFTRAEWAIMSDPANHFNMGRATFLDVDKLHGVNEPLRQKLISAMYDERTHAYVVGGNPYTAAVKSAGGRPGTIAGEFWRGGLQFKTWPVTYLSTWGARAMTQPGILTKLPLIAKLISFGTVGGAMTLQAKSLLNGKNLQDMENYGFWISAMAQGEVAGLASQAVSEFSTKDSKAMWETLIGPMYSDYNDVHDVIVKGGRDVFGEKENWGAALARAFRDAIPGGTIWYLKLMIQRGIVDAFESEVDSRYRQGFRNQELRTQKFNNGQTYWSPPGSWVQ